MRSTQSCHGYDTAMAATGPSCTTSGAAVNSALAVAVSVALATFGERLSAIRTIADADPSPTISARPAESTISTVVSLDVQMNRTAVSFATGPPALVRRRAVNLTVSPRRNSEAAANSGRISIRLCRCRGDVAPSSQAVMPIAAATVRKAKGRNINAPLRHGARRAAGPQPCRADQTCTTPLFLEAP